MTRACHTNSGALFACKTDYPTTDMHLRVKKGLRAEVKSRCFSLVPTSPQVQDDLTSSVFSGDVSDLGNTPQRNSTSESDEMCS